MTLAQRNRRILILLTAVVVMAGGAAWASVPLYDWFCRVTGYGGATMIADSPGDEILDRTITIRFDASLERDMPWEFQALEREVKVRIGETALAHYRASNPTDRPVAGTASYNVYPFTAGGYFIKVDCFCFELQVLQPGESVMMPVSFFVDPDILQDQEASHAASITLSYTFHLTELPVEAEKTASRNINSESVGDI